MSNHNLFLMMPTFKWMLVLIDYLYENERIAWNTEIIRKMTRDWFLVVRPRVGLTGKIAWENLIFEETHFRVEPQESILKSTISCFGRCKAKLTCWSEIRWPHSLIPIFFHLPNRQQRVLVPATRYDLSLAILLGACHIKRSDATTFQ